MQKVICWYDDSEKYFRIVAKHPEQKFYRDNGNKSKNFTEETEQPRSFTGVAPPPRKLPLAPTVSKRNIKLRPDEGVQSLLF